MAKPRTRKLPRIIGAIGDVNPLAYGGGVILDHGDNHPTLVWFEPNEQDTDDYGDPKTAEVYHVALDRRAVLGDVETKTDVFTLNHYSNQIPYSEIDRELSIEARRTINFDGTKGLSQVSDFGYAYGGCPYPPREYTEWWDDKIEDIAQSAGLTVEQLRESECSEDPVQRAWFYWTIAGYYGWHELTAGEVDTESIAQLRKRWALRMYDERRRKVTVYS